MTTPKRIQMTRQRPWRPEHPDAVIVARPSKWGNPVSWLPFVREDGATPEYARQMAVEAFDDGLLMGDYSAEEYPTPAEIKTELAGRDLACWCPLDQPCHADVLLAIANGADS